MNTPFSSHIIQAAGDQLPHFRATCAWIAARLVESDDPVNLPQALGAIISVVVQATLIEDEPSWPEEMRAFGKTCRTNLMRTLNCLGVSNSELMAATKAFLVESAALSEAAHEAQAIIAKAAAEQNPSHG